MTQKESGITEVEHFWKCLSQPSQSFRVTSSPFLWRQSLVCCPLRHTGPVLCCIRTPWKCWTSTSEADSPVIQIAGLNTLTTQVRASVTTAGLPQKFRNMKWLLLFKRRAAYDIQNRTWRSFHYEHSLFIKYQWISFPKSMLVGWSVSYNSHNYSLYQ
jgi:hypothetical protein